MTIQDLIAEAKRLSREERLQLLAEVSRSLLLSRPPSLPASTPGVALLSLAGTLTPNDAAEMRAAIEADCEQINADEW